MKIVQWETPVSFEEGLSFNGLNDRDSLCVYVKNEMGKEYSIQFDFCGPYIVSEEGLRNSYWSKKPKEIGWTFELLGADIHTYFKANEPMDIVVPGSRHLVISTVEVVVEVITNKLPCIKSYEGVLE